MMRFDMIHATHCDHAVDKINERRRTGFNFVTKYNDVTNEKQNFYHWFCFYVEAFEKKIDTLWC